MDDCKVTPENATGVLYFCQEVSLAEKCCKVLEASVIPDNVFAVLEQAIEFHEKDLETRCWCIVSRNT